MLVETPRAVAARMIVEGRARLATAEETASFREKQAEARRAAEEAAAAKRIQVTVLSESDLRALRARKN